MIWEGLPAFVYSLYKEPIVCKTMTDCLEDLFQKILTICDYIIEKFDKQSSITYYYFQRVLELLFHVKIYPLSSRYKFSECDGTNHCFFGIEWKDSKGIHHHSIYTIGKISFNTNLIGYDQQNHHKQYEFDKLTYTIKNKFPLPYIEAPHITDMFRISVNSIEENYYSALVENRPQFKGIYVNQISKMGEAKNKRSLSQPKLISESTKSNIQKNNEKGNKNNEDNNINKQKSNNKLKKNVSLPFINPYKGKDSFLNKQKHQIQLAAKKFKARVPSFGMFGNLLHDNK